MAQKIAFDYQYAKCSKDAREIVEQWYKDNNLVLNPTSIYIVWFAFTKNGYRCMVTSEMYKNNFFEISRNIKTGEMICHVLQQIECIVYPEYDEMINILA